MLKLGIVKRFLQNMSFPRSRFETARDGFTLVEVLVAMTLSAMIVLLLGYALRVGLKTWHRLGADGAETDILTAVPLALEKQLAFLAREAPLSSGGGRRKLLLCGKEDGLVFWSLYGAEGSPHQGLHLIGYVYDEDAQELYVYRARFSSDEDPAETALDLLNGTHQMAWLSRYSHVTDFRLAYAAPKRAHVGETDEWLDVWDCQKRRTFPDKIRLSIGMKGISKGQPRTWYLLTKVPQL